MSVFKLPGSTMELEDHHPIGTKVYYLVGTGKLTDIPGSPDKQVEQVLRCLELQPNGNWEHVDANEAEKLKQSSR